MRRFTCFTLTCFTLALTLTLSGCAGTISPLQVAATAHDSLALAQDLEGQFCWDVPSALLAPTDKMHCTNPIAATINLTDARHQAFNVKLAYAFHLNYVATAAIRAGQKPDLTPLTAAVASLLTLVQELVQTPATTRLGDAVKAGEIK
jgi:hypothetical protein